ncbi:MAG: class I tRNA ligase family protein, partial [Planctomycetaceae bacterium]
MVEAARCVEECSRIEAVDPGVDDEERINVPEPQQKLGHALADRPLAVADARPRSLAGEDGQKMSKSRRNYKEPAVIFDTYGADALRWFFLAGQAP